MTRHVLAVTDLAPAEVDAVVARAEAPPDGRRLDGVGVAMVFEKPSARTRNATEMAVVALGGHPVYVAAAEVDIDRRETAEDVARTLACYHGVLCARVFAHATLERMAAALDAGGFATPVVNLLSDRAHPVQALADLLTLRRALATGAGPADLAGRALAYVGDANNVWASLAAAAVGAGMDVRIAAPAGFGPAEADLAALRARGEAAGRGGTVTATTDPAEAAAGADALYTDVWTSMGQEAEAAERRAAFAGYQLDEALLAAAGPRAVVLHCLPAHRGEEITAGVLEGPSSWVWVQARLRLEATRGLLGWLPEVGAGPPEPGGTP